jgi:hypothetical protein
MKLLSILPYLLIFAAIAGYLYYRMQTEIKAPRRRPGTTEWHTRGRAKRNLRIKRSWEELGRRGKGDGEE